MILAKLRVEHHEARERGEGSAAQQLGTLRDGGVRAQLNDEGRVQRDETASGALFRGEKLRLSLFTRGVQ